MKCQIRGAGAGCSLLPPGGWLLAADADADARIRDSRIKGFED